MKSWTGSNGRCLSAERHVFPRGNEQTDVTKALEIKTTGERGL